MEIDKEEGCPICQVLEARGYSEEGKQHLHNILSIEGMLAEAMADADDAGCMPAEAELDAIMDEVEAVCEQQVGVTLN